MLPKLTGTKLWVKKSLDKGSLCTFLRDAITISRAKRFRQEMSYHLFEREAFDTLSAPFSADLAARHAPDLFRVRAKECNIQFLAEAIDEEIFERVLLAAWK